MSTKMCTSCYRRIMSFDSSYYCCDASQSFCMTCRSKPCQHKCKKERKYHVPKKCENCKKYVDQQNTFFEYRHTEYFCFECVKKIYRQSMNKKQVTFGVLKQKYDKQEIKIFIDSFCAKCQYKIDAENLYYSTVDKHNYCGKCVKMSPRISKNVVIASKIMCVGCMRNIKENQKKYPFGDGDFMCEDCQMQISVVQHQQCQVCQKKLQDTEIRKQNNQIMCEVCYKLIANQQSAKKQEESVVVEKKEENGRVNGVNGGINGKQKYQEIQLNKKKEEILNKSKIEKVHNHQKEKDQKNGKSKNDNKVVQKLMQEQPKMKRKKSDSLIENVQTIIVKEDIDNLVQCHICNLLIEQCESIVSLNAEKVLCRACSFMKNNKQKITFAHHQSNKDEEQLRSRHMTPGKNYLKSNGTLAGFSDKKKTDLFSSIYDIKPSQNFIRNKLNNVSLGKKCQKCFENTQTLTGKYTYLGYKNLCKRCARLY